MEVKVVVGCSVVVFVFICVVVLLVICTCCKRKEKGNEWIFLTNFKVIDKNIRIT